MWGLHGVRKRKWLRRAASNGVGGLSWPRVILDAGVLIYIPRGGGASHAGFVAVAPGGGAGQGRAANRGRA